MKSLYGREFMGIERTTFVIDKSGVIRQVFPKVKVDGHPEAVLEALTESGPRRRGSRRAKPAAQPSACCAGTRRRAARRVCRADEAPAESSTPGPGCRALERQRQPLGLIDRHPAVAPAMQNQHAAFEPGRQMGDNAALFEHAAGSATPGEESRAWWSIALPAKAAAYRRRRIAEPPLSDVESTSISNPAATAPSLEPPYRKPLGIDIVARGEQIERAPGRRHRLRAHETARTRRAAVAGDTHAGDMESQAGQAAGWPRRIGCALPSPASSISSAGRGPGSPLAPGSRRSDTGSCRP